jgi:hypothetical protein
VGFRGSGLGDAAESLPLLEFAAIPSLSESIVAHAVASQFYIYIYIGIANSLAHPHLISYTARKRG